MQSRLAFIFWFAAMSFTAVPCPQKMFGQDSSTGAIRGTVVDVLGRRIAGASIALANRSTGFHYATHSDKEGVFEFDLLPAGDYSARASWGGMAPQLTPNLHVDIGVATNIEFDLSVASAKETVTVSAEPPLVGTEPSPVSYLIDERAITGLPLNGRRFTDLALLVPGVTQDPRGLTSGSNGDLSFGGIRGYQTSYLVDGEDDNNAFFSQAVGRYRSPYQFSNEVVQEFRISSNSAGAELGRSGGAVVNVVTKSGSNQFHGSGFYFLRNSAFDATHAFTNEKPHDDQNQFGFTAGGPLHRNRAFFFAGYDQHIFHLPVLVQFVNGSSVVTPVPGAGPATPGDYEPSDQSLVFATAAKLTQQGGQFPSQLLGNTGFLKFDFKLSDRNDLAIRLNASRYWGLNNVFIDPASPITTYGISDNGVENVNTEAGSASLTTAFSNRLVSHLRAQYSRDLEWSNTNSSDPLTKITSILNGLGRSSILPRETRQHRLHVAETVSLDGNRNSWKFGGDAMLTWIYDYFPSNFGGEYIFDPIKVNPFTFEPQESGLQLTSLRAYAHQVPHYYLQNFGSAITHPDTNEYSGFMQDTIRVTDHLGVNLGVRYDLQTFSTKDLTSNPLYPDSGKVPFEPKNFGPRIGFAYAMGKDRPLVVRAGYGLFYTRIPQIYNSAVESNNGLSGNTLFLNNTHYYDHQVFPQYPKPLVSCATLAFSCVAPVSLAQYTQSDISAFSANFRTPKVHQASLNLEKEVAGKVTAQLSYTYVHGQNLIRARDVNLPPPVDVTYPVYDSSGNNFLGSYYDVQSFSTWQMTASLTCPFPPCINPLARPIPQLGAINVFESEASSVYHGATLSIQRRMATGFYFRLAYTYAHAIDDGQDALVTTVSTVQNTYSTKSERGPSLTDQRQRFVLAWIAEPKLVPHWGGLLEKLVADWKCAGVVTLGSGRPVNVMVSGDPNQDGNSENDRLPGIGRNSLVGPDYATADLRLTRRLFTHNRIKLNFVAESFNLLNRDNQQVTVTDNGLQTDVVQFIQSTKKLGFVYFPAHYQVPTSLSKATNAFAPRELQFALRLSF
ncbi:MAG: TonB-dependent receptor [Terriglobales bacterium]